jgi:hypothetical protein
MEQRGGKMTDGKHMTPWHLESMIWFYEVGLPELLQDNFSLSGYRAQPNGITSVDVSFTVESQPDPISISWRNLPLPDGTGVFTLDNTRIVVVPIAESEDLENARILCVGDQLLTEVSDRIESAPEGLEWDESLFGSLLPLPALVRIFIEATGQEFDDTNWYSMTTHVRRLLNPNMQNILPESHRGRVCPIDMPEALPMPPRVARDLPFRDDFGSADRAGKLYDPFADRTCRILTIAQGATIRNGKLEMVSDKPVDKLGPATATIPFLGCTEPVRSQIAVNLMGQWRRSENPDKAFVQTGCEPDDRHFWNGHNLLTAFAAFGKYTFEESIVVSKSGARRLGFSNADCIGAKLSNRSGQKGIVGVVLADEDMPQTEDGTPVELIVNYLSIHARMNCGQLYEAMASWTVRRTDVPFIAPPFSDGWAGEIRSQLPDTPYMQRLKYGGWETESKCLIGWVYWGCCHPHAESRLSVCNESTLSGCLRQGEMESNALIQSGAFRVLKERLTVLAAAKTGDSPWSVLFDTVKEKLGAAGIDLHMDGHQATLTFCEPRGEEIIDLAAPLHHPWLPERRTLQVGMLSNTDGSQELKRANESLGDIASMPEKLRIKRVDRLQTLLREYFENLLSPSDMRLGCTLRRSARGMIAAGVDLAYDEVGIPRRMADDLFPEGRIPDWVVINRAPTMEITAVTAFRPTIVEGDAVKLNPFVCRWLNSDYDGDMVVVLVPVTKETQAEAGELLSVVAHIAADGRFLDSFAPVQETQWGLSRLWLTEKGRKTLVEALPELSGDLDMLTRRVLLDALQSYSQINTVQETAEKAVELWELGLAAAMKAGGALDPFALLSIGFPDSPSTEDREDWERYHKSCVKTVATDAGFLDSPYGPQLLATRVGARGTFHHIVHLSACRGYLEDKAGRVTILKSGLLEGLSFDELYALTVHDYERLLANMELWSTARHPGFPDYRPFVAGGLHVISRAMRSSYPGIVFARAALAEEVDPLTDDSARLFLGMLPRRIASP